MSSLLSLPFSFLIVICDFSPDFDRAVSSADTYNTPFASTSNETLILGTRDFAGGIPLN